MSKLRELSGGQMVLILQSHQTGKNPLKNEAMVQEKIKIALKSHTMESGLIIDVSDFLDSFVKEKKAWSIIFFFQVFLFVFKNQS